MRISKIKLISFLTKTIFLSLHPQFYYNSSQYQGILGSRKPATIIVIPIIKAIAPAACSEELIVRLRAAGVTEQQIGAACRR